MYGDISAKTAEMMRKPDVAEYFASLLKRFSPKSMAQAMAEVTVTCRFLENFSGDQVSFGSTWSHHLLAAAVSSFMQPCSVIIYATMPCQVSTLESLQQQLSWQPYDVCCYHKMTLSAATM